MIRPRRLPFKAVGAAIALATSLAGSPAPSTEGDDPFQIMNEARETARSGKFPEALGKLEKAIGLAEAARQQLAVAIAISNMGEIHRLQGNIPEALNHYRHALEIFHQIGHANGIAVTRAQIDAIMPQHTELGGVKDSVDRVEEGSVPEAPDDDRERLIEEAIERIKSRVHSRKEEKTPDEPVPSLASRKRPSPSEGSSQKTRSPESDLDAYTAGIKKQIVNAWTYPEHASQNKQEGRVDVEFTVLDDGRLENVRILRSSGFFILDREAIRAVRAASPYDPIPKQIGLRQVSIQFSFNYNLETANGGLKKGD